MLSHLYDIVEQSYSIMFLVIFSDALLNNMWESLPYWTCRKFDKRRLDR